MTREDVQATDEQLVREVAAARQSHHVIVDSHPVTKEAYGFRVTAFTVDQLQALDLDAIVCTYTPTEELERRIHADPQGRALSSPYELDMHVKLQAAVAAQYGVLLGKPSYFLVTSPALHEVVREFLTITKIS